MAIKVCIDAGHFGNVNPSPVVSGYYEARMVWTLHLLLKKYLESYGIKVITTRSNQAADRDLYGRGAAAAGCNLFLSIHSNACDTESVDRAVVIGTLNGKAEALGRQLMQVITDVMDTHDAPQYSTRRQSNGTDWYGVLRGAAAVGVGGLILEHSFHTNRRATLWLMNDSNLDKMARAEAECIAAYYGLTEPVKPEEPMDPNVKIDLDVDGSWGPSTTLRSQQWAGTVMDGMISYQPSVNKDYLYSAYDGCWDFMDAGYGAGSSFVRAIQVVLADKKYYTGEIDGWMGEQTVTAFQSWLRDDGYYTGEIDGSMGPLTVQAWQRYLNEH